MSVIKFESVQLEQRLRINPSSDAFIHEYLTLAYLRQRFADFLEPAPEEMEGFDVTSGVFNIFLPQTPGEGKPIFIYYQGVDKPHTCHEIETHAPQPDGGVTQQKPYQMSFQYARGNGWYVRRVPVRAAVRISYYRSKAVLQAVPGGGK